jgi:hypothetical protein
MTFFHKDSNIFSHKINRFLAHYFAADPLRFPYTRTRRNLLKFFNH